MSFVYFVNNIFILFKNKKIYFPSLIKHLINFFLILITFISLGRERESIKSIKKHKNKKTKKGMNKKNNQQKKHKKQNFLNCSPGLQGP